MYEIRGKKRSHAKASVIPAAVHDAICQHRGYIESVDDSSIEFTSPLLQFNWNIFAPVSRGAVSVHTRDGRSVLSCKISLFRVRVFVTLDTMKQ